MIEWAITSSVLILLVLVLRRLLMGKISLRLQYGLWALVLVRLLVPVSFGSTTVSILNAAEPTRSQLPNPVVWYVGGETPDLSVAESDPSLPLEEQREQDEQNLEQWQAEMDATRAETGVSVSLGMVLLAVWVAGAVGLGAWLVRINVRFAGRLRRSRRPLEADCLLPVYVTEAAQTPCLFGLLHPAIYVTKEVASDETVLRHSLAHELTHYRHKDNLWAVLRGVCLALHWYNPLVWLAASISRRDGELCCDEATVKCLGEEERAAYGRTLLAVTCSSRGNPLLTATSMTGGGIKERIFLLAKRPKTAVYTLVAVAIIAAAAVGCTFTGAEQEADAVPDQVKMGQMLSSSLAPEPVTDPETVAHLWELYQGFTFEGTAEGLDRDNVWSITVGFSWENSQRTEGFTIFQGGLCTVGEDYETFHILRDGAELYREFQTVLDQQVELSTKENALIDTYLTSTDLDRDGEEEDIRVRQMNFEIWRLTVTKEDGAELFWEDAATPHMGWNSLYLYRDDRNGDCLLRYNPAIATGMASFSYTLFTLEDGTETVLQEGHLDFDLSQVPERAEELMAFADEINGLLNRSSLLLSTEGGEVTVGPAGWGDYLEHLDGLGDFLTEAELAEYRAAFWPEIMDGEAVVGGNPVSAFFTSYYARPGDLNFEEFLRYLPRSEPVEDNPDAPEFQALTRHPLWPFEGNLVPTPIRRYARQSVDEVLEQYAGITTEDLSGVGMDTVLYLEEYHAWYNFTSDYGPGMFIPVYGLREGSTVTLWEMSSKDTLILEETEEGFRIRSHLPGE